MEIFITGFFSRPFIKVPCCSDHASAAKWYSGGDSSDHRTDRKYGVNSLFSEPGRVNINYDHREPRDFALCIFFSAPITRVPIGLAWSALVMIGERIT